jgi:serine/alanine adding enzyme
VALTVEPFRETPDVWDQSVREWPGWTHFHLSGWKHVVEEVFGHECPFLVAREGGGRIRGLLPLVRVESGLFGRYLVSMPFVNYGGPLGTPDAVRALADHATELAREHGADLLELRSRTQQPLDLAVSHRKITVLLDLPAADAKPLWDGFPAKLRSQIRRPSKEGVTFSLGPEQMEGFYAVFSRHMRDLGTPVQSRVFFERILETFGADVWFGCAYHGGRPVAAGCGFRWEDEFEMTWASSLRSHNRIAPNMLVYWGMMERCIADGVRRFNFGRCTPGSGTHRFKQQWGGRDEPLWWYQWSRGQVAATPSPDSAGLRWGPRVWRHLPLCLANLIGPKIVRLIP